MNSKITLPEIAEDLYQIAVIINQCRNESKRKIKKAHLRTLECNLQFYLKKYHLPSHPFAKNIKSVRYNYIHSFHHIDKVLIRPMIQHYIDSIDPLVSDTTEDIKKKVYQSIYTYIKFSPSRTNILPNKRVKFDETFIDNCSMDDLKKTMEQPINPKEIKQEITKTEFGSKAMNEVLKKYTNQILTQLYNTNFLTHLILHEERKNNIVLEKDQLYLALNQLPYDSPDCLVLFTFWLNKYIKLFITYQRYLFPTKIQQMILSYPERCYDLEYITLYKKLFGINQIEYFNSLKSFITLSITINNLYSLKDDCINLLLRMQKESHLEDTLGIYPQKHGTILYYYNPETTIGATFHINHRKINQKYLQGIPFKKTERENQSIPKHLQVKKYQKSRFEDYV